MDTELLRKSIRHAARADFSRSGGPGGQNVNKVNSKVTLRVNLNSLEGLYLNEAARLRENLASRLSREDELIITASEERSQYINLERAFKRMETIIIGASRIPRLRRSTRPSRAAREERLKAKRIRSRKKTERRFIHEE